MSVLALILSAAMVAPGDGPSQRRFTHGRSAENDVPN